MSGSVRGTLAATALGLVLALTGCATVIHGTTQKVEIATRPPGASTRILPGGKSIITPTTVEFDRKKAYTLRVELAGYCPETVYLDRVTSGAIYGNLILGGIIGIAVDASNGAAYTLTPDAVDVPLRPAAAPTAADGSQPTMGCE